MVDKLELISKMEKVKDEYTKAILANCLDPLNKALRSKVSQKNQELEALESELRKHRITISESIKESSK